MTRAVAILRPEPGNARTAARIEALGLSAIRLPLFAVVPVAWIPPDPGAYDTLLITSANAVRQAGPGLATLASLPVVAVGEETAAAARRAGLTVALTGSGNAGTAIELARQAGLHRPLHLAGRDRAAGAAPLDAITVYASDPVDIPPGAIAALNGCVAMLHSTRAAERLAALCADRAAICLAAISAAVADAAGPGWAAVRVAPRPDDDALTRIARDLAIDRFDARGDKAL